MPKSQRVAVLVAGLTTAAALVLLVDRSGLIAWSTCLAGIALLAKIWFRPHKLDLGLSVALATVPVLAWVGTVYYVISTWESGEVVELTIDTSDGAHTARVWVLDIEPYPTVYYDAEPEVAKSLLSGRALQFTRAGEAGTRIPKATRANDLPEVEANRILEAMQAKYADRVGAADIWYLMLGRSRDRVAVVAYLTEG